MPLRVILREPGEDSVAATVHALVERAVAERPEAARDLAGRVVRLDLGYQPVRVEFGEEIVVGDDPGGPVDAEVRGTLPDLTALLAAPTTAGLPNPARASGRAALARLADGRVALGGSRAVARKLLRLLSLA